MLLTLSACDFWPDELESLAASVSAQVSGDVNALMLGGDVVVITVEGSPLYEQGPSALETAAGKIALEASNSSTTPLESIVISFYEQKITEDPEQIIEFIYLMREGRPELQPAMDLDATGPLTTAELNAAIQRLGDEATEAQQRCMRESLEQLAANAGDPEQLDPTDMRYLPEDHWQTLDGFGKRILLTQALTTEAMFECISRES